MIGLFFTALALTIGPFILVGLLVKRFKSVSIDNAEVILKAVALLYFIEFSIIIIIQAL